MGRHSPKRSPWRRAMRIARTLWLVSVVVSSTFVVVSKVGASSRHTPAALTTPTETPTPVASTASAEPTVPPAPSPDAFLPPAGPLTPVYDHINTKNNVVFVTMDDGYLPDPRVADLIIQNHLPVTLFLVDTAARAHREYFQNLVDHGATVEDHTMTHPQMPKLSFDAQVKQICNARDDYERMFGYRPVLFRPPFGEWNPSTRAAAHRCGMTAIFTWSASMNFGYIAVQDKNLSAGEVILMHFRPDTFENLTNLLKELKKRNLTVGRLEDYVGSPR